MTEELEQEIEQAIRNSDLSADMRRERQRDRAMHSPTFKAIAALEEVPPEKWEEDYLDEVIENVQAIDRDRWSERGIWLFVVIAVGIMAFIGAWQMKPEPKPVPIEWSCTRTYDDTKADEINCTGIEF